MATLSTETYVRKDGAKSTTYRVLIGGGRRPRQTIRLGDVGERIANEAKARIEALETASLTGTAVDRTTAAWLAAIHDNVYAKLVKVGLVEPREQAVEEPAVEEVELGELVDRYVASRSRLKPNTLRNYETTKRLLVEHFGRERSVRSIHGGHARDYREWLVGKYSPATVSREIKRARQYFEYAKDCRLVADNAFAKVKAGSQRNTKRKHFVGRDVIDRVLEACPDNNWRLVLLLARYVGLRIPSELERLTWSDIDWSGGRFTVRVPKKEHLDGHETRIVPIFPEVEPYLRRAFDEAPPGSVHVLPKRFHNDGYVYAGLLRAVERASVPKWPKLLVNLRGSRETELLLEWPEHVVHSWLGHTKDVADAHYAMVTDADYEKASAGQPIYPAQNPAQSGAVPSHPEPASLEKELVSLAFAGDTSSSVPPRGVQPGHEKGRDATPPEAPGTKPGTTAVPADVGELVRLLAGMSHAERLALIEAARSAKRPARRRRS
jgi:integrase